MASYNEMAQNYATNAKNEYLNSLNYLTDDLTAQNQLNQQALTEKYNVLFDQLNRQQDKVNTQYERDAQAAYINKLMAGRSLDETLSQLGVDTQGFGVNQRLKNETAYGQNLANLQMNRNDQLGDIAGQLADTMGQYNVASKEMQSDYLKQLLAAKETQQNMADKYYNTMYTNYMNDLQYQDALKQQQWENDYKERQLAEQIRQYNISVAEAQRQREAAAAQQAALMQQQYGDGETYQKYFNIINSRLQNPSGLDMTDQKNLMYREVNKALEDNRLTPDQAIKLKEMIDQIRGTGNYSITTTKANNTTKASTAITNNGSGYSVIQPTTGTPSFEELTKRF